jgi:hypothetical protein
MNNEISLQNCIIQQVIPQNKDINGIRWDILRLDLIHPVISGNKYFKLRFYLDQALKEGQKGILTFGEPIPIIYLLRLLPQTGPAFQVSALSGVKNRPIGRQPYPMQKAWA